MNQTVASKTDLRTLRCWWLPFAVYGVLAFLTFAVVEEDAFIYFRLAQNLADGHGLVFNRGGEHIESGSGLAWQLLLALLALLPGSLLIATKLFGVLFALLGLHRLLLLSDRFITDKRLVLFPALWLAASTPFFYWSHRGLETPLFVFSLLWLVDWCTRADKIALWFVPAFAVFCGRPEGFLMVAALAPWLWFERGRIANWHRSLLVFIVLCSAVELWRLWYFHDLLPHAFYQKMNLEWSRGAFDLFTYSLWNGLVLLAICAAGLLRYRSRTASWEKMPRQWIPVLSMLAVTTCWGMLGADWKSFNRQLSSWLPFMFLGLAALISQGLQSRASLAKPVLILLSIYSLLLFAFGPYTTSRGEIHKGPSYGSFELLRQDPVGYVSSIIDATVHPDNWYQKDEALLAGDFVGFNRNATVGRFIKANYPDNIAIIFDQAGQAPWYAGLDKIFIDNTGLTDKRIGYFVFSKRMEDHALFRVYGKVLFGIKQIFWPQEQFETTREDIVERLFALHPALILVRERYIERDDSTIMAAMAQDKRFAENYRAVYRLNRRDVVYQRKDIPVVLNPVVPPGALVENL